MGLDSYAWISSPLRRYVDLVNQRQLISYVLSEEPIFDATDEVLINIINSFETKYAKYSEFQRAMERFWCLKWLQQKDQLEYSAEVLRDSLVRLNDIPLVCKANQLPPNSVGQMVWIKILDINLYDNFVICEWINGSEPVIDDFAA
jgi:exoribonuclease-2